MKNTEHDITVLKVIDEFLVSKNSAVRSIIANANTAIGLRSNDILLAVGSLAEGLNTAKSDLDLILITDRVASTIPDGGHICWVDGTCVVDMLVLTYKDVCKLTDRFWDWHENAWDVTYALSYSLLERTILHRLYTGVYIQHTESANKLKIDTPDINSLALLKLHIARHTARTIQVDLVGLKDFGDFRSLAIASQELIGLTTDALLAGFQLVNPLVKWRSRLLEEVPSDWEEELWLPHTGYSAADHIWKLQRLPPTVEERSALRHTEAITSFSRQVFLWAEMKLRQSDRLNNMDDVSQVTHPMKTSNPLPCLEFDMDFLITPQSMVVSRLNEFEEPLSLSNDELKLLLHFDGATDRSAALSTVYSEEKLDEGRPVLEQLEKTLLVRNMLSV